TAKSKDGCAISYRVYPQTAKPRLALVHSLALDQSIWDAVVEALAGEMEILAYDCRGHGQSEKRAGRYSAQLFAEDLAAVLDHCGWTSTLVAGCSLGGCVALAFGAAYPERAEGLGLVDTSAWWGPTAPQDWRARAEGAAKDGLSPMVPLQLGRWFSDKFREAHPDVMQAITRVFLASDVRCYQSSCAMLGETDLREAAKSLRLPVAIFVGQEDQATPLAMSQTLHELIPHSTLTIIPKGRHLTPIEFPQEVAGALRDLARRRGQGIGNREQ
ncbi:MAG: alpha/beta fold hydrolase, partial [Terriglobia bacterium]